MNRDDFNMYFSGSFLLTKTGNLAVIDECEEYDDEDIISFTVFVSPEDTFVREVHLSEFEDTFDFDGFDLKPFEVEGYSYSPSYTSLRGVKDGVNPRRIKLHPMGHNRDRACTGKDIIRMFFSPISSSEDALNSIISRERDCVPLTDGFYLVRKKHEAEEEPFSRFRIVATADEKLRICSDSFSLVVEEDTKFVPLPVEDIIVNRDNYIKLRRLSAYLEGKLDIAYNTLPEEIVNTYMDWVGKNLYLPEVDVDLYRHGMYLCSLGEDIPYFFQGLPKLTNYIQEITNEYTSIIMRNRTGNRGNGSGGSGSELLAVS